MRPTGGLAPPEAVSTPIAKRRRSRWPPRRNITGSTRRFPPNVPIGSTVGLGGSNERPCVDAARRAGEVCAPLGRIDSPNSWDLRCISRSPAKIAEALLLNRRLTKIRVRRPWIAGLGTRPPARSPRFPGHPAGRRPTSLRGLRCPFAEASGGHPDGLSTNRGHLTTWEVHVTIDAH